MAGTVLVHTVDSPALRVNWDPGNAHHAGERPFPDGWEAVRDQVENVHVKDSRRDPDGKMVWAIPGEGEIDWAGQLRALAERNYRGQVTIETHLRPGPEQTKRSLDAVREMLAATGATSAYAARA